MVVTVGLADHDRPEDQDNRRYHDAMAKRQGEVEGVRRGTPLLQPDGARSDTRDAARWGW